jgi:argininosuccinate lyase
MKLWDKGVTLDKRIESYTVGNDPDLDLVLIRYDCQASIAHARMLSSIGILSDDEAKRLAAELGNISKMAERGEFTILPEQEDCHTAIEQHLTDKLGDLGKKIHTGRSRNDQVLTALRLYYKDNLKHADDLVNDFITSVNAFIGKYPEVPLPGFTHTRKAMPSSVALWAGVFASAMLDNLKLIHTTVEIIDQSPLGSGAGYGLPLEIDRQQTSANLQFNRVQQPDTYAQHSRGKFEMTLLHCLGQIMFDLNKLASDLILFSEPGFGFFELPPAFCTGSSIMPQKYNPDVLELMRAKYHLVAGYENQIRGLAANLISGYHRDYQLTKEPVMRGIDITLESLIIATLIMQELGVNEKKCRAAMSDELFATERAYELVKQGMPFREAYKKIAQEFTKS